MTGLRKTPFNRALYRPHLLLGGERTPMIVVIAAAGILIWNSWNIIGFITGVLILLFGVFALREMAKKDPFMIGIYMRHKKYRPYYPAFSRPWRVVKKGQREY